MAQVRPDEETAFSTAEDEDAGYGDTLIEDISETLETASLSSLKTDLAQARAELEIANLRDEVERLRDRLTIIRQRAGNIVSSQTGYISQSAHEQLGDYPWAKLFAAACAAWLAGKLARR
jgi:multidrug efflux pump subunit AcrA (membrane-fusion protein)